MWWKRGSSAGLGRGWDGAGGEGRVTGPEGLGSFSEGHFREPHKEFDLYFSFIIIIFCERQEEGWISGVILEGTELLFEVIIKK